MSMLSGIFGLGVSDPGAASVSQELSGLSLEHEHERGQQPDAPKVTSHGVVTFDITDKFVTAAKALKPGRLVKDGYFTLFESVGALEIMDPKMDSGCLADGESPDPDYDVCRPLLPEEVIGIIDQLLCHEMAWHLGYPLSQTLLTNLYIENMLTPKPMTVDEADFVRDPISQASRPPMHTILRAYCLGLLKTCYYVNEGIKCEHYYEEEDFVSNQYNRSLLVDIDREEIREAIQEARALLHSMQSMFPPEIVQALDFRLELRYALLRAMELTDLRSHPESIKTPWIELRAVLEQIKASHYLGTPVPDAFSSKLQRRLASTMPPRPIVNIDFEDAYPRFQRLFEDGKELSDVLKYTDSQSLLNFVLWFQAKKPQPLIYIRTLLQSYVFKDNIILGSMSIRQIMDDDLSLVVLPCSQLLDHSNDLVEAPHDPRFAMAHQMEVFRQRAAQPYLDIFRAFCQNRCRIRRNFCHAIQEWELLQVDAEEVDQLLQVQLDEKPMVSQSSEPAYSLPLSSWAYLYKLRLMEWIVQLGFELEVYQPDELGGMYWYLAYLAQKRMQHVERIKAFTLQSMNDHRARLKGRDLPAAKEALFTRSLSYLRATMIDAAATTELSKALYCIYTALYRTGLVAPPPRPYSTDELRYEIRMRPFASIGLPELPAFDQFERQVKQQHLPTDDVLEAADRSVAAARKAYERIAKFTEREAFATGATHDRWTAGTTSCAKSAITASIAVMTLRKALSDTAKDGRGGQGLSSALKAEVPKPDKGYHEWWIVPRITRA
ncbi:hypothetical protein RB594_004318 [Gaeumannomyces avenae]